MASVKLLPLLITLGAINDNSSLTWKALQLTFFKIDVFKVLEEPEEYVVEEKLHIISKRVEAEPAEGISTLELVLALCVTFSMFSCSYCLYYRCW